MSGTVLPCAAASSLKGTSQDVWESSTERALASAQVFCCSRTLQGVITSYEPVVLLSQRTLKIN